MNLFTPVDQEVADKLQETCALDASDASRASDFKDICKILLCKIKYEFPEHSWYHNLPVLAGNRSMVALYKQPP